MNWVGPLIQAGASLMGGMMGPSLQDQSDAQVGMQKSMDKQRPKWIRQGAEKAGFNPLVFAGPGGMAPAMNWSAPSLGAGIAGAGAAIADGFSEQRQVEMQKAELELERQRLEALREEVKLTPKVPGIYQRTERIAEITDRPASLKPQPTPAMPADPPGPSPFPAQLDPVEVFPDTSQKGGKVETPRGHEVTTDRMTAEDGEKFYGEVGELFVGGRNAVEDMWKNYAPTPWKDGVQEIAGGRPIGGERNGFKVLSKEEMEEKGRYPNKDNALWWLDHLVPNW